ncbi:hypothetical protein DFP72DRAFT_589859 [Ephemerocybe angulata]|uniref:Uncharacterized protein n=1 Tax=Ephemerocybe angulata TaxID=980116 RepID=A0A8H6LZD8_9AGAR|nr:hypothetical protein DFP72DRAFT_589859 [Tulosesus angulatus]
MIRGDQESPESRWSNELVAGSAGLLRSVFVRVLSSYLFRWVVVPLLLLLPFTILCSAGLEDPYLQLPDATPRYRVLPLMITPSHTSRHPTQTFRMRSLFSNSMHDSQDIAAPSPVRWSNVSFFRLRAPWIVHSETSRVPSWVGYQVLAVALCLL